MEKKWDTGVCNEKAGFLFKQLCSNTSNFDCQRCNKPICAKHSRAAEGLTLCLDCVKKKSQDENWRNNHYRDYDDDPYFYGDHYYRGYGYYHGYNSYRHYGHGHFGHDPYGHSQAHEQVAHEQMHNEHDPNDFTEADAESLQDEGMDDFESDINES